MPDGPVKCPVTFARKDKVEDIINNGPDKNQAAIAP
jgi:hypothetical protein